MRKNTPEDVWKFIKKGKRRDCWLWTGGTFSGRYGRFFFQGKAVLAHRFVCELVNGEIPAGMLVMHKCNVTLCCNPHHLKPGTLSENGWHASTSGSFKQGAIGIRGIGFDKNRGYWTAGAYLKGKRFNLYTGPSKEKAIAARKKWNEDHDISFNLNAEEQR